MLFNQDIGRVHGGYDIFRRKVGKPVHVCIRGCATLDIVEYDS